MNGLLRTSDRLIAAMARAILRWAVDRAEPDRRPWVEALGAELEAVTGGPARLLWALGGLSLLQGTGGRRTMAHMLRTSSFGLALGGALLVAIVWSNVIVPSHESDSEYAAWYVVFYAGLLVYFLTAGLVVARRPGHVIGGLWAGTAAAVVGLGIAMLTFIVIDNLFLDVVMQQPDKIAGFRASGLTIQRDYVNQGNRLAVALVLPVVGVFGAGCGALGGLVRKLLDERLSRPA